MACPNSLLRTLALVTSTVLAAAPRGAAQMAVDLTPIAGYYIASDIWSTTGGAKVELSDSFMYGGRLTLSPNRVVSIEFGYTRTGSDATLDRLQGGQSQNDIGRLDIDNFDINFLSHQGTGNPRTRAFGLLGFGWAVTRPDINSEGLQGAQPESRTLFNFNFAVGTKVAMGERAHLRLEAKWRVTSTNVTTSSGLWCDPYGFCYAYASNWYNSGELIGAIGIKLK